MRIETASDNEGDRRCSGMRLTLEAGRLSSIQEHGHAQRADGAKYVSKSCGERTGSIDLENIGKLQNGSCARS